MPRVFCIIKKGVRMFPKKKWLRELFCTENLLEDDYIKKNIKQSSEQRVYLTEIILKVASIWTTSKSDWAFGSVID